MAKQGQPQLHHERAMSGVVGLSRGSRSYIMRARCCEDGRSRGSSRHFLIARTGAGCCDLAQIDAGQGSHHSERLALCMAECVSSHHPGMPEGFMPLH